MEIEINRDKYKQIKLQKERLRYVNRKVDRYMNRKIGIQSDRQIDPRLMSECMEG